MFDLLLIGSGGREHALAWKLAQSPSVGTIYCAPGNGGTAAEKKCCNVNLAQIGDLVAFAKEKNIHLTLVGPEAPLAAGIVDIFKQNGLRVFGPDKKSARLEGSKALAKEFMQKYGVKTASYAIFTEAQKALSYLEKCAFPVVVKADGLAAGKGVIICQNLDEGKAAIESLMCDQHFGKAGSTVVIEEYLEGVEASILSITDGESIIPFLSAMDHKQIFDGGRGANTGGMGAICPNPHFDEENASLFARDILKPTLKGLKEEGLLFSGIIFFGLMLTKKGVYLLEYNIRFGDPETQAVLPLLKSDLFSLIEASMRKELAQFEIKWQKGASCALIAASNGYPGPYEKGKAITIGDLNNCHLFIAGAEQKDKGLVTSGGRVLAVTASGEDLKGARKQCYQAMRNIHFAGIYYRSDIGLL